MGFFIFDLAFSWADSLLSNTLAKEKPADKWYHFALAQSEGREEVICAFLSIGIKNKLNFSFYSYPLHVQNFLGKHTEKLTAADSSTEQDSPALSQFRKMQMNQKPTPGSLLPSLSSQHEGFPSPGTNHTSECLIPRPRKGCCSRRWLVVKI